MSQLDSDSFEQFSEAFASPAAPDEGPPAEPEDPAPSETEATAEPEAPQDDRPRDELGRFTEKQPLAGKFKTVDDLESAYLELQRTLGSKNSEIGELRQAIEDRLDSFQRQQHQVYDDDTIERNPGAVAQQIAVQALQAGSIPEQHPAYEAAMEAWFDENPRQATNFLLTLQQVRFQHALEERTAPVQQTLRQQQEQQAIREFGQRNPDIVDYADQIQQIAGARPALAAMLQSDDPQARVEALDTLYLLAKAQSPARATTEAVTDHARKVAADTAQAVADATVVTTGNTNQGEAPVMDEADRMWEEWQTLGISHLR